MLQQGFCDRLGIGRSPELGGKRERRSRVASDGGRAVLQARPQPPCEQGGCSEAGGGQNEERHRDQPQGLSRLCHWAS